MIQWYPGHMAKAKREIQEKLKLVDIVVELVDARAPESSANPMLQEVIGNKLKLTVLMKSDLADDQATAKWLNVYKENKTKSLAVDVNKPNDIKQLIATVKQIGLQAQKKMLDKGVQERPVRALVAGVPNVGKSTLINRLAGKRIANIGDRPGITKKQQWIKVKQQFELLDTPGILWPKFDNPLTGTKLAAIGTIKYELVPEQDVAAFLLQFLSEHYKIMLEKRYDLTDTDDMWDVFVHIGKRRGALQSGGDVNMDKVADIVLQDFRNGKIGKITLDQVNTSVE